MPDRTHGAWVPAVAAVVYALICAAYIVLSDRLVMRLAGGDAQLVTRLSTLKGLAFIAVTAALLYGLLRFVARTSSETARRVAEADAEANERLRPLLDGTPHLFFFQQDLDGVVTFVSPSVVAITGRPVAKWLGRHDWYVTAGPANRAGLDLRREHVAGRFSGEPLHLDVRHADGHTVTLEIHESGVFRGGELIGLQGIAHDVTEARRAAEQRFFQASLLDHVRNAVAATDTRGTIVFWNRFAETLLQWRPDEVIGRGLADVLVPESGKDLARSVIGVLVRKGHWEGDLEVRRRDGTTVSLNVVGALIRDSRGAPSGFVALATDVTERKREERVRAALHAVSEAASTAADLDRLFARVHAIIAELMPARNFYIAINEPAGQISFPYFVDEHDPQPDPRPIGKSLTDYVLRTGEPLLASPEVFDSLAAAGEVEGVGTPSIDWLGVPLRVDSRTFGVLVVQSYAEGVRYGEEEKGLLTFVSHQIAMAVERKRAEQALRGSEQRLRDIIEHSSNLFYSHTPDHVLTYISPQTRQFFDCEPEEALVRWTEFSTDNPINRVGYEICERAIRTGMPQPVYQLELVGRRGRTLWVEVSEAPVVRDGRTVAIVGALTDITERRRAEEAQRESEERYRALVELSPDGIAVHCDGRIVFANQAGARLLGFGSPEEAVGVSALSFVHPDSREMVVKRMTDAIVQQRPQPMVEEKFLRRDGTPIDVEVASAPLTFGGRPAVQVVVRDISNRVRLEAQLRQAQKLEAVGRLAGGVAHDFNNLLQAILSSFSAAAARRDEPAAVAAALAELERLVRRGSSLTRQLLLFARRDLARPARQDLNNVVREGSELLRRLVRENIRFTIECDAQPLPVRVDQGQLEQVLLNLVVNAVDAMPLGGDLAITTGRSRDEAWVRVRDTGSGVAPELRERIFEPFFTTKGGAGSGLGLSVVHGIVAQHAGRIELDSEPGRGSCFTVILPLQPAAPSASSPENRAVATPDAGHGESVLLVEDEAAVRDGLAESLRVLGYTVTAVDSGEAAEAVSPPAPFRVLLTDLMLPGVHGADLAARLRERWPELVIIVMSGYAEDRALRERIGGGNVHYLQKPFDLTTLAHTLSEVLGGSARAAG